MRALASFLLLVSLTPVGYSQVCEPLHKGFPDARLESITQGVLTIPASEATFRSETTFKDLPRFCRVRIQHRPRPDSDIGMEVWLPETNWNGRYLQVGNGGFAGTIHHHSLVHYLKRGFAVAGTDNGHKGYDDDTRWSIGHPEKIVDFGHRAVHETNQLAQTVVQKFYGKPAVFRYMTGCSDGGREGLMEAQRYPEDFHGILAGAPALRWTHGFTALLHVRQVLDRLPDKLQPAHIQALRLESLKQCDAADGLKDGIVDPMASCEPNFKGLMCPGPKPCFSKQQMAAVQAIYDGPQGVHGFRYTQGFEDGPFQWPTWFTGPTMWGAPEPLANSLSYAFFGPMVYQNAKLDVLQISVQEAVAKADRELASILNADRDTLSRKRYKILHYHGWADAAVPAQHSIDYYTKVLKKYPQAQDFYRLFMVSGMGHCLTGSGPQIFNGTVDNQGAPEDPAHDALLALMDWVEKGRAPEALIATQFVDDDPKKPVRRTRPLCPYPQRARWDGKGDPNLDSSFTCR
ncbi:tannase/feruloyl esterase family alpha/beta hydrolase [Oligoflexus tunisiensis]|uniref:tannase/feruloyl esterase family alpha/beta hydrolase n=1 Tax=Oligoflexus tunisiensis TaxID=708132 RepID=UPI000A9DFED8|nr:tannase/feruloyl esterase family alpha/beta hydrolase [Oligoflexus tunisiensis]